MSRCQSVHAGTRPKLNGNTRYTRHRLVINGRRHDKGSTLVRRLRNLLGAKRNAPITFPFHCQLGLVTDRVFVPTDRARAHQSEAW